MDRVTRTGGLRYSPVKIKANREAAVQSFIWLDDIKLQDKRRGNYVILIGKYQEYPRAPDGRDKNACRIKSLASPLFADYAEAVAHQYRFAEHIKEGKRSSDLVIIKG